MATVALFIAFGAGWLADLANPFWFALMSAWLFAVILIASFAAVGHAEAIAAKLGEPLGTLVLTLAVTGIEVTIIAAVMYGGKGNATLARDAMFAVVMIVLVRGHAQPIAETMGVTLSPCRAIPCRATAA